ncbi:DUF3857 domain-containing protein [Rapidithrix thailandica]|uniref:DUF3857 domain-containing protein n=1 Tax=Rapidithrix thailandica TaxID=413964 RepID=A0AAW9S685_9BACT
MKRLFHSISLVAFFLFTISQNSFAQSEKFGKIDKQSLEMDYYEKDSSANAVVLFDVGRSYYEYNRNEGFKLVYERHRRIKIFNQNGYDYAEHAFSYYNPKTSRGANERVYGLKGYTYLLENGKIAKYKLEKDAIFEEEVDKKGRYRTKFTMPNINDGAVVEYTYKIVSDGSSLRDWYFQGEIPVMWSEYTTEIPEYFHYKKFSQGFESFHKHEENQRTGTITFMGRGYAENLNYTINTEKFVIKDAPALKDEKFITTEWDYFTQVEFQLATVRYPNSPLKNVLNTWEKICEVLLQHEDFGGQIRKKGYLKEVAEGIKSQYKTPEEKALAAYAFVRENIKWNGEKSLIADKGSKKTFDEKVGNSADLNLMLVSLLHAVDINAQALILSTRDHGKVNPFYPLIDKFNYVIAYVKLGEKTFLLDATEKTLPYGMLPYRCLNQQGRIISEKFSDWVSLYNGGSHSSLTSVHLKMNDMEELSGVMQMQIKDYSARPARLALRNGTSEEEYYKENIQSETAGYSVDSYTFKNVDDLNKPLDTQLNITLEDVTVGGRVYLNPILESPFTENPLKQEERKFPVDFGCPQSYQFNLTLELPEKYEVEELPQNIKINLPNKGGYFQYLVGKSANLIQLRCVVSISQTMFLPEEYPILKEFINQIVNKQKEQIVLKERT